MRTPQSLPRSEKPAEAAFRGSSYSLAPTSGSRSGQLSTRTAVVCAALVLAGVISRRPDLITNPQLIADEGNWFGDAYMHGVWHSLLHPQAGYLCIGSKLANAFAVLVPLVYAPAVCCVFAIAVQVLTFWYLLTPRLELAAPLRARALLCFLWLGLPNAAEVLTLNNTQWILATLGALVLLSKPPESILWRIFDIAAIFLMGLTGPYCILLLPIVVAYWFFRRAKWTLTLLAILGVTAVIQTYVLTRWPMVCVPRQVLKNGALRVLATKVFLVGTLAMNSSAYHAIMTKGAILPGAIILIGLTAVVVVLFRAPLELRLFVVFACLVVAATAYRLHCDPEWQWQYLAMPGYAERYWYIPKLGYVACLLWLALDRKLSLLARSIPIIAVLLLTVVSITSWRYPAFPDYHWSRYARALQDSPPGTTIAVPVNPGWIITLTKR